MTLGRLWEKHYQIHAHRSEGDPDNGERDEWRQLWFPGHGPLALGHC